jgi:tetratricopeptide (TPR) repeat protein
MNKFLTALTIGIITLSACNSKTETANSNTVTNDNQYELLYKRAMAAKDYQTAITAIQLTLMNDSTNGLRDSLPELFGAVNNLEACMLATMQSMERYPDNEKFKNIMLICLQQTGDMEGQFALLNDLYQRTKKSQYIIQVASIQMQSGNTKQAMQTIDMLMKEMKNSTDSIDVFLDETNKQKVPVMAALWNMKGYGYMQQKNIEKAKEAFFQSMEIYPEFVMPKRNLQLIFDRKMR